jgi:hypothetical protein
MVEKPREQSLQLPATDSQYEGMVSTSQSRIPMANSIQEGESRNSPVEPPYNFASYQTMGDPKRPRTISYLGTSAGHPDAPASIDLTRDDAVPNLKVEADVRYLQYF